MLDVFITSRVRRKIVVVYAKYPDFRTHVRGLAKLIKEDPGNIQRELKKLEKVIDNKLVIYPFDWAQPGEYPCGFMAHPLFLQ